MKKSLKVNASEFGVKEGDKVICEGRVVGRLDLRDQKFDVNGNPIPFDTPRYHCPYCNKKVLHLPLIYKKDDKLVISGEFAFHAYDTHGIPTIVLEEIWSKFIRAIRPLAVTSN